MPLYHTLYPTHQGIFSNLTSSFYFPGYQRGPNPGIFYKIAIASLLFTLPLSLLLCNLFSATIASWLVSLLTLLTLYSPQQHPEPSSPRAPSPSAKAKVFTTVCKEFWPSAVSLISLSPHSLSCQHVDLYSDMSSTQGLCAGCSFSLEYSSFRYLHDPLPHFLQACAQMLS